MCHAPDYRLFPGTGRRHTADLFYALLDVAGFSGRNTDRGRMLCAVEKNMK